MPDSSRERKHSVLAERLSADNATKRGKQHQDIDGGEACALRKLSRAHTAPLGISSGVGRLGQIFLALLLAASALAQTPAATSPPQKSQTLKRSSQSRSAKAQKFNVPAGVLIGKPYITLKAPQPQSPQAGQPVRFTITTNLKGWDYYFNWGEAGQPPTRTSELSAVHTYSTAGTYSVQVTAEPRQRPNSTQDGPIAPPQSNVVNVNVVPLPPPKRVLKLSAIPSSAHVGEQVTFTATLDPPDGSALYRFDFGDHNLTNAEASNTAVHNYMTAGTYEPKALATLGKQERVLSQSIPAITITAIPPHPPKPRPAPKSALILSVQTPTARAGQDVRVDASLDPPQPARYEFNWGDGSRPETVPGGHGVHPYEGAQRYTITVKATPSSLNPRSLTKSISVTVIRPWSFWQWIRDHWQLVLAAIFVLLLGWRLVRRPQPKPAPQVDHRPVRQPSPHLKSIAHSDAGVHKIKFRAPSGPHVSLTLKPGIEPGEDKIKFRKSAAAD